MSERYELYYAAGREAEPLDVPENEGLRDEGLWDEGLPDEDLEPIVRRLRETGAAYQLVDVSTYSREQLEDAYVSRAVPPAVRRQYGVKRVFGTNKYAGSRFGRGVPALVVLDGDRPVDVYPHEENGRIVTIADYLRGIAGTGGTAGAITGAEIAARMDAVRAKFTGVGMTATELIEDGRRR